MQMHHAFYIKVAELNQIQNFVVETFLFYMFKSEIFKTRVIEVNTNDNILYLVIADIVVRWLDFLREIRGYRFDPRKFICMYLI